MKIIVSLNVLIVIILSCSPTNKHKDSREGITAMITATTGSLALEGGLTILKKGGTAMDAAVSTSLSQIALAGGSWVSYAGLMNVVYYEARTGKIYNMNASFNTVLNEHDPLSIPGMVTFDLSKKTVVTNGRAVLVPGYMAGVEAAHKKFGVLPREEIFKSAISIAENGFPWNDGLQYQFNYRKDILARLPETDAIFKKSDGTYIRTGDTFVQPALARTLRNIVAYGSQYMYAGAWAEKFVKTVQAEGGKITMDDLGRYQVIWSEPLKGTYQGYDLYMHGFPAYGGVKTIEALNLLEAAQLSQKAVYYKDPQVLKELSDIIRVGDISSSLEESLKSIPNLDFSMEGRLKKENARVLYELVKQGYFAGAQSAADNTPKHSDAIVVVDKWGNICAMTHSINAASWGANGIFVDGVSIPDPASFQQKEIAKAGPGKRLPDPTSPGIVLKNGRPILGFASISAGLHAKTVTCLLAVLGYTLTPQEAIDLPGLGALIHNTDGSLPRSVDTTEFSAGVLKNANKLGGGGFVNDTFRRGYWVGILIDSTKHLYGSTIKNLNLGGRSVGY